jgi:hypothetical protein
MGEKRVGFPLGSEPELPGRDWLGLPALGAADQDEALEAYPYP